MFCATCGASSGPGPVPPTGRRPRSVNLRRCGDGRSSPTRPRTPPGPPPDRVRSPRPPPDPPAAPVPCFWSADETRRLLRGLGASDVAANIRFLTAIAAAARAGLDFELRIPAPGGRVFVPGVGGVAGLGEQRLTIPVAPHPSADLALAQPLRAPSVSGWLSPSVLREFSSARV
jgi:hypothetical protein